MPLSPDDWRRLEALFEDALAMPASRRREYLAGACSDNPALQQEVERLIACDERAATFLEIAGHVDGRARHPGGDAHAGAHRPVPHRRPLG
jgi:eukaryotic-like serine/threonine-protein kinase